MSARRLEGVIRSANHHQTAIVAVAQKKQHPLYLKRFIRQARFAAHNPNNTYGVGDVVVIEEARPVSKTKRWVIRERIRQGQAPVTLVDRDAPPPAPAESQPAPQE